MDSFSDLPSLLSLPIARVHQSLISLSADVGGSPIGSSGYGTQVATGFGATAGAGALGQARLVDCRTA